MRLSEDTRTLIRLALHEDLGPGDVSAAVLPETMTGAAVFLAKSDLVLAGVAAVHEVYAQLDPTVQVELSATDEGRWLPAGTRFGRLTGPARSLLSGERLALNLLQRLSGVATHTRRAVDAVAGTKVRILDTRKTGPGLRQLEKHAVRVGGGQNHRFGLFDGVMLKDNHVAAFGGVEAALRAARRCTHHLLKIECEVDTLAQLDEALAAGAEVILLDNMSDLDLAEAVRRRDAVRPATLLEASGNMKLERLPRVAATGVDFISMGALTHSITAADISLEWTLG